MFGHTWKESSTLIEMRTLMEILQNLLDSSRKLEEKSEEISQWTIQKD